MPEVASSPSRRATRFARRVHAAASPCLVGVACVFAALRATAASERDDQLILDLRCPALDEPARSELEARARADLHAAGHVVGRLEVTCSQAAVSASLEDESGRRVSASEPTAAATVDAIFQLITRLSFDSARERPKPPPSPSPSRDVADTPPARNELAASDAGARVWLIAGATSLLWFDDVVGVFGPHAAFALQFSPLVAVEARVTFAWATSAPRGVSTRVERAALLTLLTLSQRPRLVLGAGIFGERVTASAEPPATPSRQSSVTYGIEVDSKLVLFPKARFSPRVGPVFSLRAHETVLSLDGDALYRVPPFAAGAVVELGFLL